MRRTLRLFVALAAALCLLTTAGLAEDWLYAYATAVGEDTTAEDEAYFGEPTCQGDYIGFLELDTTEEIGDLLELTVHGARVTDRLGEYGEEAGDRYRFVTLDLDLCNISFDDIDLKDVLSAKLEYAGRYEYEPYAGEPVSELAAALVGRWEGFYMRERDMRRACVLEITSVGEDGKLQGTTSFGPMDDPSTPEGEYTISGSVNMATHSLTFKGVEWITRPNNSWHFYTEYYLHLTDDGRWLCGLADNQPFYLSRVTPQQNLTMGMLEEMTHTLVFRVPDRVARDLENCTLFLTVAGTLYELDELTPEPEQEYGPAPVETEDVPDEMP